MSRPRRAAGGGATPPQLAWEARTAPLAAAAAIAAVVFFVAGIALRALRFRDDFDRAAERLVTVDQQAPWVLLVGVLQALGTVCVAIVLWYLARAIGHRRPELSRLLAPVALAGPLVLAAVGVAAQLDLVSVAREFAGSGPRTDARAEQVREGGALRVIAIVGAAGTLLTVVTFVLVGLNGIRTGVLSRFMGTLAIILGVLYIVPFLGGPGLLQLFWLGAVAAVALDRWPGGRGPAWRTGRAEPWPVPQRRRRGDDGDDPPDGDPPEARPEPR